MTQLIKDIDILPVKDANAQEFKTTENEADTAQRKLYIESYGCQMNFSDSEIVSSIMKKEGFGTTSQF